MQISLIFWLKNFFNILQELKLERIHEKICIFWNDWLLVFFYVNDITVICHTADLPKMKEFKKILMIKYKMRFINNLEWFLDIHVIQNWQQHKIWLCQDLYIKKITKRFNLIYLTVKISMISEKYMINKNEISKQEIHLY